MSILVPKELRLIVQGITGNEGLFHTRQMLQYNTNIVAGVSPGKGGDWVLDGKIPVFDTVKNAVDITGANASVVFVPAKYTADAIFEAVDAALDLVAEYFTAAQAAQQFSASVGRVKLFFTAAQAAQQSLS